MRVQNVKSPSMIYLIINNVPQLWLYRTVGIHGTADPAQKCIIIDRLH
jgi:hypothetical protein